MPGRGRESRQPWGGQARSGAEAPVGSSLKLFQIGHVVCAGEFANVHRMPTSSLSVYMRPARRVIFIARFAFLSLGSLFPPRLFDSCRIPLRMNMRISTRITPSMFICSILVHKEVVLRVFFGILARQHLARWRAVLKKSGGAKLFQARQVARTFPGRSDPGNPLALLRR